MDASERNIAREQEKMRKKLEEAAKDKPSARMVKKIAEVIYRRLKGEFNSEEDKNSLAKLKV
jgi:hypothetical protein